MWFSSLMRNPKRSDLGQRRRTHRASRQRSTFRPQLEALEDRWLPSLTVTNNLDSGPGSLRYEIARANENATIRFAPSLDGQTITLTSGELDINTGKNLTIQGPGAGLLTISGGTNPLGGRFRVFEVDGYKTTVTLSGLTISNGGATGSIDPYDYDGEGGAILNFGRLTVSGCTLSGNRGVVGGGAIWNESGGLMTVSTCTLSANSGYQGGGIYNAGAMTVSACTLSANSADQGGGIDNVGSMTVSGCTLSGNSATLGGGIDNVGTMTVRGCTVSGNSGGGISNAIGASLTVSNSVFSANSEYNISGSWTDGGGNTFS